jgi:hypothetical protein
MINETNKQSWCVNAEHAIGANNDGSTKMCCMIKNIESMVIGQHTIAKNFNKKNFFLYWTEHDKRPGTDISELKNENSVGLYWRICFIFNCVRNAEHRKLPNV